MYHTAAPAYTVIGGVVNLTGSTYQDKGDAGTWTTLPSEARTAGDVLEIEVDTASGAGAVGVTGRLGLVSSVPFSDAQTFTSLDGIAYPKSS